MTTPATTAVQLNIHAESDFAEEPAEHALLQNSDQLLVAALNAVARLRDTVDRLVVFSQLRQMLELEQRALEHTIANDQGKLNTFVRDQHARLNELRARRECLLRTLGQADCDFSSKRPSASSA